MQKVKQDPLNISFLKSTFCRDFIMPLQAKNRDRNRDKITIVI